MTAIQTIYNMTCAGIPLPLLVLYFLWYSLLGWCMETTFCSISERRFVFRGFLKGPICPIYGFGVMVMVLWLQQFTQNFFPCGSTYRKLISIRSSEPLRICLSACSTLPISFLYTTALITSKS